MIYLDNSATTAYKPQAVIRAAANALEYLSANPGRSGHSASLKAGMLVYRARQHMAAFLGGQPDNVLFTGGCTDALNLGILGTVRKGGHVVTTAFEHNSVLRPLFELKREDIIRLTVVPPRDDGLIHVEDVRAALESDTYLVAAGHIGNVTGAVTDVAAIGQIAHKYNAMLLVDGAQSVGYTAVNVEELNADMLAVAPHKGLHAAMGVGILYAGMRVPLTPVRYGGTGTLSSSVYQPHDRPEGFESGTLPLPAIATLIPAIDWVTEHSQDLRSRIQSVTDYVLEELKKIEGVTVYTPAVHGGIAALNIRDYASDHVADILSSEYDIAVRSGLHCAPLAHKALGTEKRGIVRASFGYETTFAQADMFLRAVREIAS